MSLLIRLLKGKAMQTLTARQVFTESISLVLDNDRASYELIQAKAKALIATGEPINSVNWELADYIKDYVENNISSVLPYGTIGDLLIREICFGWGIDPYFDYAEDITRELKEAN